MTSSERDMLTTFIRRILSSPFLTEQNKRIAFLTVRKWKHYAIRCVATGFLDFKIQKPPTLTMLNNVLPSRSVPGLKFVSPHGYLPF